MADALVVVDHFGVDYLHGFIKPFLIPTLAAAFWVRLPKPISKLAFMYLTCLLLAWIGDVVLIFGEMSLPITGLGMGFFLAMHLGLAWCFYREVPTRRAPGLLQKYPFAALLPVGFSSLLLLGLLAEAPAVAPLVVVFAPGPTLMALAGLHLYQRTETIVFEYIIGGIVMIFISHGLWGIDKFVGDLVVTDYLVMITYGTAMFFFTKAFDARLNLQHQQTIQMTAQDPL